MEDKLNEIHEYIQDICDDEHIKFIYKFDEELDCHLFHFSKEERCIDYFMSTMELEFAPYSIIRENINKTIRKLYDSLSFNKKEE